MRASITFSLISRKTSGATFPMVGSHRSPKRGKSARVDAAQSESDRFRGMRKGISALPMHGSRNFIFQTNSHLTPPRDLSDSTRRARIRTAFAHCLIGYRSLLKGFGKSRSTKKACSCSLAAHQKSWAEAIQTILRAEGSQCV